MRGLLVVSGVVLLLGGPAPALGQGTSPSPLSISIEAKFDTATEHILIPADIAGQRFWCNLDSGFSALFTIDKAEVGRAGLALGPAPPTPDGAPARPGDQGTVGTVRLGDITLRDQPLIVRAFPPEAPDMDCVLGVGVLRPYVVEFDFMTPEVRLYAQGAYRPDPNAHVVTLEMARNTPYVRVSIELPDGSQHVATVVADTGAAYYSAVLTKPFLDRANLLPALQTTRSSDPAVVSSSLPLLAARPEATSLGTATVRQPVVALVAADMSASGWRDGLLGEGFFRQFTTAFDFENGRLHLTPNARHGRPQAFDASGVGFAQSLLSGDYQVAVVLPDSPAERADVQVGDILRSLNGRPSGGLTLVEIRDLLSVPDSECVLLLDRAGQERRLTVQLKERLPAGSRLNR